MAVAVVSLALLGLGVRVLPGGAAGSRSTGDPAPGGFAAAPVPGASDPVSSATARPVRSPAAGRPTPSARPPARKKTRPVSVPENGSGSFVQVHAHAAAATTTGTLKRYDVRVEKGLQVDPDQAALLIERVLNDKRSWRGTGRWRFQLVPAGHAADLHAYIVTPGTTDRLCAPLLTRGEVSCQNGNRVVLNAKRWTFGVKYYGDDVANYRRYLINHEFGHALGHGHVRCPGRGQPAPVMMQQTKGLGGCRKNPWPLPPDD